MPLVERVAAQQVFAQRACCPDAELRAARGVDAVAYGDDGVEAVESQGLVGRSNVHFLHIASSDKPLTLYSLDAIISVGYRVNSARGNEAIRLQSMISSSSHRRALDSYACTY